MKSHFRPEDPRAVHQRFGKVWAKVSKKLDAERELLFRKRLIERSKRAA